MGLHYWVDKVPLLFKSLRKGNFHCIKIYKNDIHLESPSQLSLSQVFFEKLLSKLKRPALNAT